MHDLEAAGTDVFTRLEDDAGAEAGGLFRDLIAEYLAAARTGDGPVSTPLPWAAIDARFDEPLPLDGRPLGPIVERLRREVIADSNRLAHPMAMGHQVSSPIPAAVWTDALIAALNQSIAVAEMSPTLAAIERRVLRWMCTLAGFGPDSGGTFTSGGTEATFAALLAARSAALPHVWRDGVGADAPVVVCGEHAHYAVSRAVGQLGLGLRSLVSVPSRDYRLDTAALEETLARLERDGRRVMAVVATAGSTATGSFDDLDAIGRLCRERGLWLHVDAAHGGSALLSPSHRERLRGLEHARSLAWDAHKMMLLPLAAGMVLVRDEIDLDAGFAQSAPYLFHGAGERVRDQGVRSFQCSRRGDVLKLWVVLQRLGARGLGDLYDHLCTLTRTLHARFQARPDFETLHAPECNILCFRYRPAGRDEAALDALNLALRESWNRSGRGWITTTLLSGRRVLRVTLMNPRTRDEHLGRLVDGLAEMGADLAVDA
jgi:L-2,4-diaminobutyrate decarboxylase